MRELLRAVLTSKELVVLLEPDAKHGGLSPEQLRVDLDAAGQMYRVCWANANLSDEVAVWLAEGQLSEEGRGLATRLGQGEAIATVLHSALFGCPCIEWNRIPAFMDVTMRLLAERLLPEAAVGTVYTPAEVSRQRRSRDSLAKISRQRGSRDSSLAEVSGDAGRGLVVHCSRHNAGALELVAEVGRAQQLSISVSSDVGQLRSCECMLVYLDARTWRSAASDALAEEVRVAMAAGLRLLLAHEMPSAAETEAERHPTEFAAFFEQGATPADLIDAGIYQSIAVPLKGGAWRQASLVMFAQSVSAGAGEGQGWRVRAVHAFCARVAGLMRAGVERVRYGERRAVGGGEVSRKRLMASEGGLVIEMAESRRVHSKKVGLSVREP